MCQHAIRRRPALADGREGHIGTFPPSTRGPLCSPELGGAGAEKRVRRGSSPSSTIPRRSRLPARAPPLRSCGKLLEVAPMTTTQLRRVMTTALLMAVATGCGSSESSSTNTSVNTGSLTSDSPTSESANSGTEPDETSRAAKPEPFTVAAAVAAEPAPETFTVENAPAVTVPEVAEPAVPSKLEPVAPVIAALVTDDLV